MTVASGVVRRGEEVLVAEVFEEATDERVFRPFSTTIDGDESPEAAVSGAFRARLGVDVADATPLGTFEDERVFVVETAGRWLQRESGVTVYDPETGESTRLCWLHFDDFRRYGETLRPAGVLDALAASEGRA